MVGDRLRNTLTPTPLPKTGEGFYDLIGVRFEADGEIQPGDKLRRWAEAFDAWLEVRRTRFSPNVGKDSYLAWKEFLAFTRKTPWDIQVEEVEAYIAALKGKGLRAGTIQQPMTELKKFYEHCQGSFDRQV